MDSRFECVCRVCLTKDTSSVMRSLADEGTRQLLLKCTSVSVQYGDKYPQQLCRECWNQCRKWSEFKEMAQENDRELKLEEDKMDDMVSNSEAVRETEEVEGIEEEEVGIEEGSLMVNDWEMVHQEGYSLAPEEVAGTVSSDCEDDNDPNVEEEEKSVGEGTPDGDFIQCAKSFRYLSALKDHKRVHSNKRPFQCNECKKTFKTNPHLRQHKLVHSGIKPFQCDECNKKFKSKRELKQHKLVHSGIKALKCDECEKSFKRKQDLKLHKVVHSGIKALKCDECEKSFKRKQELKRHKLVHSGIKPFKCDQCDKKFTRSCILTKHKKVHQ